MVNIEDADRLTIRQPFYRKKGFKVAASLLVGYVVFYLLYGRYEFIRDQKYLMQFYIPPSEVIYEEDPSRVAALLRWQPSVYEGDENFISREDPIQWELYPVNPWYGGMLIFLHERHVRGGQPRLVVLAFGGLTIAGNQRSRSVRWQVINPGTFFHDPVMINRRTDIDFPIEGVEPIRIFAGQPDPVDPSHFTVDFEVGAKRDVFDGWLRQDDTIALSLRNGPEFRKSLN